MVGDLRLTPAPRRGSNRGRTLQKREPALRKGLACSKCYARKVRCDGQLPSCGACSRSAKHLHRDLEPCLYNGVPRGRNRRTSSSSMSSTTDRSAEQECSSSPERASAEPEHCKEEDFEQAEHYSAEDEVESVVLHLLEAYSTSPRSMAVSSSSLPPLDSTFAQEGNQLFSLTLPLLPLPAAYDPAQPWDSAYVTMSPNSQDGWPWWAPETPPQFWSPESASSFPELSYPFEVVEGLETPEMSPQSSTSGSMMLAPPEIQPSSELTAWDRWWLN